VKQQQENYASVGTAASAFSENNCQLLIVYIPVLSETDFMNISTKSAEISLGIVNNKFQ
jgi:hypothetical protein